MFSNLVNLLIYRSRYQPQKAAYIFLQDGELETARLTYQDLDLQARALASHLQSLVPIGSRVLLICPPGLGFITAFFGCLYAGVVAVPVYPPRPNQSLSRLQAIVADARPSIALTTTTILVNMERGLTQSPDLQALSLLAIDKIDVNLAPIWQQHLIKKDTLAFLQYTSGSTGIPKGVMVSHSNLMHNLEYIKQAFELTPESVSVTWLPSFHDMGLIDGIIQPLYAGFLGVLMPPVAFLQRPIRWLQAIQNYRATHSGGPNFSYELCIRKITAEQRNTLDLRSWRTAYNGAEPIRSETLQGFADAFKPCGFQPSFLYPCYGMAETTLMVAGGRVQDEPIYFAAQADALEQNRVVKAAENTLSVRHLVGCGRSWLDTKIVVVTPDTLTPCASDEVGEIWVSGSSVTQGYWNRSSETAITFQARLADTGEGPFLRTGDLGFLSNGELFVTGRLKDLIIIRGRNHYPQDIELTVEQSHSALRPGCGATFSVEMEGDEQLVVVQELERSHIKNLKADEIFGAIRQAVATQHELQVYAILLLKTASIPKTSSGKIQRRACRAGFLGNNLEVVASSIVSTAPANDVQQFDREALLTLEQKDRQALLESYVQKYLANLLKVSHQINLQQPLNTIGLDSLRIIELQSHIDSLGMALPLESIAQGGSVSTLAAQIDIAPTHHPMAKLIPDLASRYQPFPLTDMQQAYWMGRSNIFELSNVACHFYQELECTNLDIERYTLAWQQLIVRHDMLRTIILPDGQQQILERVPPYDIQILDLRGEKSQASQLESIRQSMSHNILPSDQWPLFEIRASLLNKQHTRIHISFDLLIADAWSLEIIFRELKELYCNPKISLPSIEISFRDCVLAEIAFQCSKQYQLSLDYWEKRLPTLPPGPELPIAKSPSLLKSPQFARRVGGLEPACWQRLKARAAEAGLTPAAFLLAVFAEVLTTWSKSPRFTLNLTLFNRLQLHPQVNELVGDFTSSILLVVDNTISSTFESRAQLLQKQLWEDLKHRYVSGVHVLRELAHSQVEAIRTVVPVVFTSTLGLSNQGTSLLDRLRELGDIGYGISQTPQVWLDHQVFELNGALVFNWDAVEELFPPGLLSEMFETYCCFLQGLANDSDQWQKINLQLLPPAQLEQITAINSTAAPISDELLHTLFIKQVKARLHQVAVVAATRTLTYEELYRLSIQVGCQLQQLGAYPNTLVAVVMEKGWEQVVGVLGVLMSGAAYLPLDPAMPKERLWHILERSEVSLALTQSWIDENLEWPLGVKRLCIDNNELTGTTSCSFIPVQKPEDTAYVIYTSGSTGLPKGVVIDHRGAVNTILDINQRFAVCPQDRVLAMSALGFDLSVYDIFGILAAGGTIVITEAAKIKDPAHWIQIIAKHQITIWNSVPALMQMLIEYAAGCPEKLSSSLRLVLLSGDWISLNLPNQIKSLWKSIQVISLGGATEASIWSIFYPIETINPTWHSIPYGCPLTNQRFHVLNELLEACPAWVTGQLYIGGIGLAKGYWRDEVKTNTSFIQHPRTQERLYKTGDLGRYLPDGNVEFLGREDFQVKVNGYRIELGEIQFALTQHPSIKDAVVIADGEYERKHLVAYIVLEPSNNSLFEVESAEHIQFEDQWAWLIKSGSQKILKLQSEVNLQTFSDFWQQLEYLSSLSLRRTLTKLGLFINPNERHSVRDLLQRFQIQPKYELLLVQWLKLLEEDGLLQQVEEATFISLYPLFANPLENSWQEISSYSTQDRYATLSYYLQRSTANHVALLKGEVSPQELLFPNGSWETAEGLYQFNPLAEYHNGIVREILSLFSQEKLHTTLRVLEVGAGTGGTTAALLPVLSSIDTIYTYTDVSPFFITQAKEKFQAYSFIEYNIFDINIEPVEQGYRLHEYDIVIAANVLHNATNLNKTLQYLQSLLTPCGLILLIERTESSRFQLATVGFIEKFGDFEDERQHTNLPLLSVEKWQEAMKLSGFENFVVFPKSDSFTKVFGQHVIVGQASYFKQFNSDILSEYLRQKLPDYMVPHTYLLLDAIPLTPNGKVDRHALTQMSDQIISALEVYVSPRNQTEQLLAETLSNLLKLDKIGIYDNFFKVGGDSLLAIQFISKVGEAGFLLTPKQVFQHPTIAELAQIIDSSSVTESNNNSLLVNIQLQGTKMPLFCIAPATGNVDCYYSLSFHLGTDQPLYGLQLPELNVSIELIAERHIELIRTIQPHGPYSLAAWSMGGIIAFEVAQQLWAQNQEVKSLTLLDIGANVSYWTPTNLSDAAYLAIMFVTESQLSLEYLQQLCCEEDLQHVLEQARKEDLLPSGFDLSQAQHLVAVYKRNLQILHSYTPQPYAGCITLFRASEQTTHIPQDPFMGWDKLAPDKVKVGTILGNHYTILRQPRVKSLAEHLRNSLVKANSTVVATGQEFRQFNDHSRQKMIN